MDDANPTNLSKSVGYMQGIPFFEIMSLQNYIAKKAYKMGSPIAASDNLYEDHLESIHK